MTTHTPHTRPDLRVIDQGADVPYYDLVEMTEVPYSMPLWHVTGASGYYAPVVLTATAPRPWQMKRRPRTVIVPRWADLGVRLGTPAARTRVAFQRGVERLADEQCDRYGRAMARLERIGPWSPATREVLAAESRVAMLNAWAAQDSTLHRARFPWLYSGRAATTSPVARYGPLSDVTVSSGNARPVMAHTGRRYDHDDRLSWELERAADEILAAAGDLPAWGLAVDEDHGLQRVDVIDRHTRQPHTAPDRVAYRGESHYVRTSHRYHTKPVVEGAYAVDAEGVCTRPLVEYRTDVVGHGYGWIGHRRIVIESRGKNAGARGRRFHPFTANEGSIRRRWAKATPEQVEQAASLKARLIEQGTVIVHGARVSITETPRQRVIVQTSDTGDRIAEGSFALDDYVRRATLV